MSLSTTQQHFTKFYLAAFLRAPDLGGLNYWANEVQSGKSLQEVGGVIFSLPIVTDIYPANLSDLDFVEAIYHNVFGRTSDAEGLNYWSNEIATLRNGFIAQGHDAAFAAFEARGQLTINMINAGLGTPDGTDGKAYIVNRLTVAEYAAEQQLAQGEEVSVAFLLKTFRSVNADAASVTEGKSAIVSFLTDEAAPTAQLTPITSTVQLEAIGVTNGDYIDSHVSAIGSSGAYVVTWMGYERAGDGSIFVQQFNADGTIGGHAPVQLEAIGVTNGYDYTPQVSAIGSSGAYVVTWTGTDSTGDSSIFVQQFNADGTISGHAPVQLEAIGVTNRDDSSPQVSAIGSSGAYVVTWHGIDSAGGDGSIFVQQFNADGTIGGHAQVKLGAIGVTDRDDSDPQISAIGSSGAYVVTWRGVDSAYHYSVFVQQFNADGTLHSGVMAQSTELGTAYLVRDSVLVTNEGSILAAADNLWNAVELTSANTDSYLTDAGLASGSYHLYTVDLAGNLSQQSVDSYTML